MELSVKNCRQDDRAVVAVVGEIDLSNIRQLQDQINAAIGVDGIVGVVVDLSGVTFMDSSGISALLWGRRVADAAGKQYEVVGADGVARQILDVTGVWTHLAGPAG